MKIPPAIPDDIRHALGILESDSRPVWHLGAASMLRNIAADIEAFVAAEKEREAQETAKP